MKTRKNKYNDLGIGMLEVMIVIVITGIIGMLVLSLFFITDSARRAQDRANLESTLSLLGWNITTVLNNSTALGNTIANNSSMSCLAARTNTGSCAAVSPAAAPQPFAIIGPDNNPMFQPTPTLPTGVYWFSSNGTPCSSFSTVAGDDKCPLQLILTWSCNGCCVTTPTVSCRPVIQGSFTFSPTQTRNRLPMNMNRFQINTTVTY
jgi:hypothetical protein